MKKILLTILVGLGILIGCIFFRAALFESKQINDAAKPNIKVDRESIVRHLSEAIQIKTISHQDKGQFDSKAFEAFHKNLEHNFPKLHKVLKKEVVAGYSLIYKWEGKNQALKPIMLSGHFDVVPIDREEEAKPIHMPFKGEVDEGFVWGRGTLDNKGMLISTMEAVELLLSSGYEPERTIYLVFTHDEELMGIEGTRKVAELFKSRKISFEYILDEGSIVEDAIEGITKPIAFISVAEKGSMNIRLTVKGEEGHTSMAPQHTAIGVLSEAIYKLEKNPYPAKLNEAVVQMFEYLGPEMSFPKRLLFSNLWLFQDLIKNQMEKAPASNALIRSNMAATIFQSGIKVNILPKEAAAEINYRILPGDSSEEILKHIRRTIQNENVYIEIIGRIEEPSSISRTDVQSFTRLNRTIKEIYPQVIVAPNLLVGGTNSKHFDALSPNIYRFSPMILKKEDLKRLHGIDERISIDNLEQSAEFYSQLITNTAVN